MNRARTPFGILAAIALTGCHFGATPQSFAPAQGPAGVVASIEFSHGTVEAELLNVRDSAIVVLNQDHVVLVPYRAIRHATFLNAPEKLNHGETPNVQTRAALRSLSRFPQGLSPALEQRLLLAYHETVMPVAEP